MTVDDDDGHGMVNRLARVRASQRAHRTGDADARPWAACSEAERDELRSDIRALLRAQRQPTGAQLAAFARACDSNGQCLVRTGWRAMIDAALNE